MRYLAAIFGVLLCVAVAGEAIAATRYVSDQLRITLRSGAGTQYKILDTLTTGARVEVLETRGEEWARVRAADGQVGWVLTQYLMDQPAARDQLAQARNQLESARQAQSELESQLQESRGALEQARERIQALETEKEQLSQRLSRAEEGLEQYEEVQQLKKQVVDLQRTIQELEAEKARLADRTRHDWFMVGGGVMLTGMLLGIIVTRIRWRKRSTWGDRL
ncbi:TIGR04211 family SH3 domain-containing protein [Ectothiorhodospiraceae bacterium WFHF3C12]|nr:TIGR04211 family SH3 domain-containing protein [Ectothiorhodospiraceae bacterium WFHF3C12]